MSKKENEDVKKDENNLNTIEEFQKSNCIDAKIEIYINDIIKKYFKENKKKIKEEIYSLDWGTKISSDEQTIQQEHTSGRKCHKIFIGTEKVFDGDMIRYDILNLKAKDLDEIKINIDEMTDVKSQLGKEILKQLKEKFVPKDVEEEAGYQKILEFMKKENLNKDDLLMAVSALFDEITGDKNENEEDNDCEDDCLKKEIKEDKKEINEIISKHTEKVEQNGASNVSLVKYKKSVFTKIIDWFYE